MFENGYHTLDVMFGHGTLDNVVVGTFAETHRRNEAEFMPKGSYGYLNDLKCSLLIKMYD
jgi:hypothetical protein